MARIAVLGVAERADLGQSAKLLVQRLLVNPKFTLVATPASVDTAGWRFGSGRDGSTGEETRRRESGGIGVP